MSQLDNVKSKVQEVCQSFEKKNAYRRCMCCICFLLMTPIVLQFIAPYAGTSIAEFFRDTVTTCCLLYLMDLTKHAHNSSSIEFVC